MNISIKMTTSEMKTVLDYMTELCAEDAIRVKGKIKPMIETVIENSKGHGGIVGVFEQTAPVFENTAKEHGYFVHYVREGAVINELVFQSDYASMMMKAKKAPRLKDYLSSIIATNDDYDMYDLGVYITRIMDLLSVYKTKLSTETNPITDYVKFVCADLIPYKIKAYYSLRKLAISMKYGKDAAVALISPLYLNFLSFVTAPTKDKIDIVLFSIECECRIPKENLSHVKDILEEYRSSFISDELNDPRPYDLITRDLRGKKEDRPAFSYKNSIVIGNIGEINLRPALQKAIEITQTEITDITKVESVSFDIPTKYKFAVFSEFPLESCCVVNSDSEKILIRESTSDEIYLLYVENGTELKGISMSDETKLYKNFILFESLDTSSDYEICPKEITNF